jgi:thiol-disulfide isomerase/thioredoxin
MRHSTQRWLRGGIIVGAIVLLGCSAEPEHSAVATQQVPAAETDSVPAPALKPGTANDVLAAVHEPGASAVLVNLWATWCGPCRDEFPELVRVANEYRARGLRTVLVSADFEDQRPEVTHFLQGHGVTFPSYIKTGDDMQFLNALEPRLTGALPATLVFDGNGKLVAFWEGRAGYHDFEAAVLKAIRSTGPKTS